MVLGFRHCDPRFPFLWLGTSQPAARWHAAGEGPAHYFADTPNGAWAEFLRHEGITDVADLAGVRRSLWAVELPDAAAAVPDLPDAVILGGEGSYAACQDAARQLRAQGCGRIDVVGAALLPGEARGWVPALTPARAVSPRNGRVWVCFGALACEGWPVVDGGQPPAAVLPLVSHFVPSA